MYFCLGCGSAVPEEDGTLFAEMAERFEIFDAGRRVVARSSRATPRSQAPTSSVDSVDSSTSATRTSSGL